MYLIFINFPLRNKRKIMFIGDCERGKEPCPATDFQRRDNFQDSLRNHVHPAEPGIHLAVKIKKEVQHCFTLKFSIQTTTKLKTMSIWYIHIQCKIRHSFQVRVNAVQHIFTKSAPCVVEKILAATDVNAPPASIPKPINMAKTANQAESGGS